MGKALTERVLDYSGKLFLSKLEVLDLSLLRQGGVTVKEKPGLRRGLLIAEVLRVKCGSVRSWVRC